MEKALQALREFAKLVDGKGVKLKAFSAYAYLSGYCPGLSMKEAYDIVCQLQHENIIDY